MNSGVTQSYGGLLACRLLLGLFEGGLFPGISRYPHREGSSLICQGAAVYLTLFYTKRELALRIGYLFVSAAIAGMKRRLPLAIAVDHEQELWGSSGNVHWFHGRRRRAKGLAMDLDY